MPKRTRTADSDAQAGEEFSLETRQAFAALQDAVRGVLATCTVDVQRAADLGRSIGLDYAVAWQIHTLASQADLEITPRVVPKPGGMERFLKAIDPFASATAVQLARDAYAKFEATVATLAGDRETFDAIVALQRPHDAAGLKRIRRAAYKANANAWGLMCRVGLSSTIMHDNGDGTHDFLAIRGRIGFQRLYPGAMATIPAYSRFWRTKADGDGQELELRIARCELIEEACSKPIPEIVTATDAQGVDIDDLQITGITKRAESTFFWRNLAQRVSGDSSRNKHTSGITSVVPTEHLILDMLIPSTWMKNPAARCWSTPDSKRSVKPDPEGPFHLPFEVSAQSLGRSIRALHTPLIPNYGKIIRDQIESMGWQNDEYDIFRCEVPYPLLHTTTQLAVEEPA